MGCYLLLLGCFDGFIGIVDHGPVDAFPNGIRANSGEDVKGSELLVAEENGCRQMIERAKALYGFSTLILAMLTV